MHLTFIPYGKREQVELLLRDMEAQKHQWVMTKGKKTKKIWLQGQVRFLPFGVYEYVFPKEDLDAVLNTLNCKIVSYDLKGIIFAFIKKMFKLKPIPKYSEKQKYLGTQHPPSSPAEQWRHVSIHKGSPGKLPVIRKKNKREQTNGSQIHSFSSQPRGHQLKENVKRKAG